jgi:cytoskeletal protein CcmA (bactofilin family)
MHHTTALKIKGNVNSGRIRSSGKIHVDGEVMGQFVAVSWGELDASGIRNQWQC